MSRPRTYKTEAVVLKQMPLGEADRILTLCTPDMGKVRAVAKGVRRIKSKLGGHLELFNNVSVSIAVGRNLDVVNEVQVLHSFREFRHDLRRVSIAMYMAELVDGFTIEDAVSYDVYQLLLHALDWLGRASDPDLLLRFFEFHLLEDSGYKPEVVYCVECRAVLEPGDHAFSSSSGGVLCPGCWKGSEEPLVPISLSAMKVLRFIQRHPRYDSVEGLAVQPDLVREVERLLRNYIRYIFERDWKSVEFMDLVRS